MNKTSRIPGVPTPRINKMTADGVSMGSPSKRGLDKSMRGETQKPEQKTFKDRPATVVEARRKLESARTAALNRTTARPGPTRPTTSSKYRTGGGTSGLTRTTLVNNAISLKTAAAMKTADSAITDMIAKVLSNSDETLTNQNRLIEQIIAAKTSALQSPDDMRRVMELEITNRTLEERKIELAQRNSELEAKLEEMQRLYSQTATELEATRRENISCKDSLIEAQNQIRLINGAVVSERDTANQLKSDIDRFIEQRHLDLAERRRLHNTIQDLKGSIRVAVRVRPVGKDESSAASPACTLLYSDRFTDKKSIVLQGRAEKSIDGTKTKKAELGCTFDRVFPPECTQSEVYAEVDELIQSSLDGYRVCIAAYGQSGSGKTYSMFGPPGQSWASMPECEKGIMPRAVEKIFHYEKEAARDRWTYTMTACFFEIYKDNVRDLLYTGTSSLTGSMVETGTAHAGAQPLRSRLTGGRCKIARDKNGDTYVQGVSKHTVTNSDELNWLLAKAYENRAMAATNINDTSSRSHAIFQLDISGMNDKTNQKLSGQLNLLDLAGSENLEKSGALKDEERKQESIAINKSLTALATVICALVTKSPHIPFRDSKLTSVLQPALSGDSKTMILVNLSPEEANYGESVNSLKFAARVSGVEGISAKKRISSDS